MTETPSTVPAAGEPAAPAESALQREVEAGREGTTTFEAFGQTWVVPVKQHLKHIARIRNSLIAGYGNYGLLVAETFLDSENHPNVPKGQVERLYELNPTEPELADFAKRLSKLVAGVDDAGKLLALVGVLLWYEDAVEGSFWRHGADLGDLYRDQMTLRQLNVRLKSLSMDDPLMRAWQSAQARAEQLAKSSEHDETMRQVDPDWGR